MGNSNISEYFMIEKGSNHKIMYLTKGIRKLSKQQFEKKLSQGNKSIINKNNFDILIEKLTQKSIENFILAIEIYNRPSLINKVEAFCILIMNSWEILLKMLLIKNSNDQNIIYKEDSDKTISITEAILKLYNNDKDIIKENLLMMAKLRNESSHLLIEEVRPSLSELFQANIINYIETCHKNDIELNIDNNSGMLTLIIPGENKIIEVEKIYGKKTHLDMINFLDNLKNKKKELNSEKFTCDITYSVYLSNKQNNADVTLTNGNDGQSVSIKKINKDITATYKYKFKQIIYQYSSNFNNLNQHTLSEFIKKHNIKGNDDYHYNIDKLNLYSEAFINFLKKNF